MFVETFLQANRYTKIEFISYKDEGMIELKSYLSKQDQRGILLVCIHFIFYMLKTHRN
jgi:hypothetical protein